MASPCRVKDSRVVHHLGEETTVGRKELVKDAKRQCLLHQGVEAKPRSRVF